MAKLKVYNIKGEEAGNIELAPKVFGVKVNPALVHQAVVAQMSNERQNLAHTKDRSEVRGGGRKPWRQKGTGRARVGSNRSPIWIGGGVTFGPRNERNFSKKINKRMKQKALLMALSDRVENSNLVILNEVKIEDFKTKIFNDILKNIEKSVLKIEPPKKTKTTEKKKEENKKNEKVKKYKRSILFINASKDEKLKISGRNLAGVKIINLNNINILDLIKYRNLVITEEAIKNLEEKYNK